jgi:ABC-type phosphate transport system substrate-binding protein
MRRIIAIAAATLATVALAAGCGNSASAGSSHPSYAKQLESFGDVIGASGASQVSPTSQKLVARMGSAWLVQVCQSQSDAKLVGMKPTAAQNYFAQGYNVTAPAAAPSADAVFSHILGACATEGL